MTTSEIKGPVLVIGLGGAGARIASDAAAALDCKLLVASNDKSDLECCQATHAAGPMYHAMHADTGAVINPTVGLVRSAAYEKIEELKEHISESRTVLLVCNLAGKAGCAMSSVVSEACATRGVEMISLAIMPFGYEKSKLFGAGVALRRLRESSACTIVLDNDSLLESNPDLTPKECYAIADAAISSILHAAKEEGAGIAGAKDNILAAGRTGISVERSLRDALKMLCGSSHPESVRHSMIYVAGGQCVPTGMLRAAARITEYVLAGKVGPDTMATLESDSPSAAATSSEVMTLPAARGISDTTHDGQGVIMLSAVQGMEKFEAYDPLGMVIPDENVLDWDAPECSIDCSSIMPERLRQLE